MRRQLLEVSLLLMVLTGVGSWLHKAASAAPVAVAGYDGGPAPAVEQLRELVRQLRELRQDYYRQKARDDAEIEAARHNGELLRSQVEELRAQEAALDTELADYQSQIGILRSQLEHKTIVREEINREVVAFASAQVTQIEEGIPYKQQERIARLRASSPDPNHATTVSAVDRLNDLWSYAQEELRLAASSETYTERATLEEQTLPYARYFRVGQLLLGYVTEDGQQAAMWLDGPQGGRWQPISDPRQFAQLRDAAEILDRRQAPRFVSLPIVLNDRNPNEKSRR